MNWELFLPFYFLEVYVELIIPCLVEFPVKLSRIGVFFVGRVLIMESVSTLDIRLSGYLIFLSELFLMFFEEICPCQFNLSNLLALWWSCYFLICRYLCLFFGRSGFSLLCTGFL